MIGMPGAGKSTLGVILAKTIGYGFLDTDILFCEKNKTTLQEFINRYGIEEFLKAEEAVVESIACKATVIATGGSAVLSQKAMTHLKKDALTVFIDIPLVELKNRIHNMKTRGIVMSPSMTIGELYKQILPLYKKYADAMIPQDLASVNNMEEMLEEAIRTLKHHLE